MPNPDRPPLTRAVVLRGIGFAAAIALGAVAVWLTVTSDSQKSLRIGMLVGLWGLLLGAYSMFGARRGMGVEATDDPGREIALRESRTLERSDDADARRDWEARLERLITREISTAVGRETAALRNEIAHLRQELVDKVGGQLRLERIETTRVIGSDLEALQDEVRQLKDASGTQTVRELLVGSSDPRIAVRPVVEPARVRPVSRPTADVEADIRPAVRPEAPVPAAAAQQRTTPPGPALRPTQPAQPAQSSPAARPSQPVPAVPRKDDAAAQRAPISHAAAQAAQSRTAGTAASQLGGQQLGGPRRADTPPNAVTPAGPSRPATPADRPVDAAALVHRAPPAASEPPAAADSTSPRQQAPQQPSQQPRLQQPAAPQQPAQQPATNQQRPPAAPRSPSTPAATDPKDPFASLPRLSRFTDFELDPVDSPSSNGNGHHTNGNGASGPEEPTYSGRRRRTADEIETAAATPEAAGRHSSNGAMPAVTTSGGRRRREDNGDDGSELLARLLARETSER